MKLQVHFRESLIHDQVALGKAQQVVQSLSAQQDQLQSILAEERLKNDRNAARVRDMEEKLEALEHAIEWMEQECD